MTDTELADHAWWGWFWTTIEHAAFVGLIVALAIEFVALKLAEPHKKAVEDAKDVKIADLNKETAQRVGWVERSDTHQLHFAEVMGFAGLNPSYGLRAS